jgi:hypothetical protein
MSRASLSCASPPLRPPPPSLLARARARARARKNPSARRWPAGGDTFPHSRAMNQILISEIVPASFLQYIIHNVPPRRRRAAPSSPSSSSSSSSSSSAATVAAS